jgi:hypothetical protein
VEATEVLSKAWAAVQESGVPEHLQEIAFKEAVTLLKPPGGARRPAADNSTRSPDTQIIGEASDPAPLVDVDELMDKFSTESGISSSELIEVFFFDPDGTAHLNVAARRLGDSTAAKAKAVAAAIAAAYHFASDEPLVPVELIRAECIRLKCFDKKNFFTHMGNTPGTVLSGTGSGRVLRIKSTEIEGALRAVVNLARGAKD